MKYRSNFVTNSSSSSFIIGKKDDEHITVEFVYNTIKNFYREFLEKLNIAKDYCDNNPKYPIQYNEKGYFDYIEKLSSENKREDWDKREQIEKDFERRFGLDYYTYNTFNTDWVYSCDTYEEYEKFWENYQKENNKNKWYIPFRIYDYFYGNFEHDEYFSLDRNNDELLWYYDNEEVEEELEKDGITDDNICLYMLGRVCISSECGHIPDYVVEKLISISELACNHMG